MNQTYRQRLKAAVSSKGRITLHCPKLAQDYCIKKIRSKAAAYIANNPAPRAIYLIG